MTIKYYIAPSQRTFHILILLAISMVGKVSGTEPAEPTQITLYPAAEPTPSLKYRLLPKFIDRKPGNAAVFYGKVTAEQSRYFGSSGKKIRDKVDRWGETSLHDLLEEDARVPFDIHFLRHGALCTACDWQMLIHEGVFFELLLPEVQQTRDFTRILSATARIQVARGEFEQAIETIQTGLAFGKNIAVGETLVNGLVGVATSGEMLKQVLELVQQSDAPNLYWALSMLPQPFIDMRGGLEAEMSAFDLSYPELRNLETKNRSPEDWQKVLRTLSEYYALFSDHENSELRVAEVYLKTLGSYPTSKQSLINQGLNEELVETMPKEQVVSLAALHSIKHWQQEIGKYYHLPYLEAMEGMSATIERAEKEQSEFVRVLKSLKRTRETVTRNTRRFEVLRILEALRIHAAANGGKLPVKLDDITEVPIPIDPVTGKAFEYQLTGETATLKGPAILDAPLNYVITMKEKIDEP